MLFTNGVHILIDVVIANQIQTNLISNLATILKGLIAIITIQIKGAITIQMKGVVRIQRIKKGVGLPPKKSKSDKCLCF